MGSSSALRRSLFPPLRSKNPPTKLKIRLSVSANEAVNSLLLFYKGLSKEIRGEINALNLNTAPAMERCQNVHGKGNCVKVTNTFVNRKCPDGYRIEGCCNCVVDCPANWVDKGYWCIKPEVSTLKQHAAQSDCTIKGKKCSQWGNSFWIEECPPMHDRIGGYLCVPRCPLGWNDQGQRCQKPRNMHIGHPFLWAHGDN